ncbi:MAG: PD-(D/E)XK nuclease family protein [Cyclobacteriaceae bacterium]
MKTFLQEIAEKIYKQHPRLEDVTIIFPNRRAALYFRKHVSAILSKPVFAPNILTIEDFISGFSNLQVPDKLTLISLLFRAYRSVSRSASPEEGVIRELAQFYFWGEMLLGDFEEVDKYLISSAQLFKDLSHQKELDATFDFLTDEQKEFLKSFWGNFDENQSVNKRRFLQVWRRLTEVYDQFKSDLISRGLAYEGMLHRIVSEQLPTHPKTDQVTKGRALVFAGFNALTAVEEKIITFFVEKHNAQVFWDMDAYYINNEVQEAGKFFREYQTRPVLGKTFHQDIPAHFQEKILSGKEIQLYGAAQPVGQAKLMAQVLKDQIAKGIDPEETLIVLPDEKLLMPVLYGISSSVEKLNVTMGFPLTSTPLFNFIELLIDLQITRKSDHFNHRQVLGILGHPYVVAADPVSVSGKRKEILKHNWVHIPKSFLATEVPLHRLMFVEVRKASGPIGMALIFYIKSIIQEIGASPFITDFDKEYAFHFLKFFNRLESVLTEHDDDGDTRIAVNDPDVSGIKLFLRLFRQLIRMHKIPFRGEPLKGLQVMGVLETRNLDFKNVFILSLNEGAFPSNSGKGSYIPHNIRKAYGMPTLAHHDAMYSYLFYRTLQRAENIFLFYNSETDVLGQGEMSRYLQQLLFESGMRVNRQVLHNPIQPRGISPIVILKNDEVLKNLEKLNEGNAYFTGISPSALNSYIECRLKFYFRYVAKVKEPNEVEEELDARVLGNFLHLVMEGFYKDVLDSKKSKLVEKGDFKNAGQKIDGLIDQVFIKTYKLDPDKKVAYAGQRLVVKEVVKRFAKKIVDIDEAYAPFTMEAIEQGGLTYTVRIDRSPYKVVLAGKIDRVDRKGNLLRIIDYKTGKDELDFESVSSLFARQGRRNKAAFQTLLYALLYVNSLPAESSSAHSGEAAVSQRVVPGLINRMNVFDEGFTFGLKVGKQSVDDVEELFPEFTSRLKDLLDELFDPGQPFDQTTELDNCKFCPYTQICYR